MDQLSDDEHSPSSSEFFQELSSKGMKEKSIKLLIENEIDSIEAVGAITMSELDSLGLSIGQKAILRKMKQEMGCPGTDDTSDRGCPTTSDPSHSGARPKQRSQASSKGKYQKSSRASDESDMGISRGGAAAASPDVTGASEDCEQSGENYDGPAMWEWKSNKGWHRYGTTASDHLEKAYNNGDETTDLSSVQPELTYTVEFKRMRQVHNSHKGKRRPVRRTGPRKPDSDDEDVSD